VRIGQENLAKLIGGDMIVNSMFIATLGARERRKEAWLFYSGTEIIARLLGRRIATTQSQKFHQSMHCKEAFDRCTVTSLLGLPLSLAPL
jgi:hypothetical protein